MNITFLPLQESHFPLLLKWLEAPHVKKWWDQDIRWTPELIQQKYGTYVNGYKLVEGAPKDIQAFIVEVEGVPIGYVQLYNAYDFPRSFPLVNLPQSPGAFDLFIGEENFLRKGIGSTVLRTFLDSRASQYEVIFADPDADNLAAIKTYEKVGFVRVRENSARGEIWMIRKRLLKAITFSTSSNDDYDDQIKSGLRHECENLTGIHQGFDSHTIYAIDSDDFIGGIIAYVHGPILWTDALWVAPKKRELGIGKALMDQIIDYGKTKNCSNIQLNTFFPEAHKFFTSCGFKTLATIPNWKYGLTCYFLEMKL